MTHPFDDSDVDADVFEKMVTEVAGFTDECIIEMCNRYNLSLLTVISIIMARLVAAAETADITEEFGEILATGWERMNTVAKTERTVH